MNTRIKPTLLSTLMLTVVVTFFAGDLFALEVTGATDTIVVRKKTYTVHTLGHKMGLSLYGFDQNLFSSTDHPVEVDLCFYRYSGSMPRLNSKPIVLTGKYRGKGSHFNVFYDRNGKERRSDGSRYRDVVRISTAKSGQSGSFSPRFKLPPGLFYIRIRYYARVGSTARKKTVVFGKWKSLKRPPAHRFYFIPRYCLYTMRVPLNIGMNAFGHKVRSQTGPPLIPVEAFWRDYFVIHSIKMYQERTPGTFSYKSPYAKPNDPRQGYQVAMPPMSSGTYYLRYKVYGPQHMPPPTFNKAVCIQNKRPVYRISSVKKPHSTHGSYWAPVRVPNGHRPDWYEGPIKHGRPYIKRVIRSRCKQKSCPASGQYSAAEAKKL